MLPDTVGIFSAGGYNDSGVRVTEQTALAASAVYACCAVIAQAVASLPVHVFTQADGTKLYDHAVARLLAREPNEYSTAPAFRETMMVNALLYGNCYAYIERDTLGVPAALYPLPSDRTRPVRVNGGMLYYETRIGSTTATLTPDQVFHVANFSLDGITGISPVQMAKQSVGLSVALERYAAKLFSNGGNIGGILKTPPMNKEALTSFVASWKQNYVGLDNALKVAVLPGEYDFKPTTMDPEKGQMTAARVHQVREVARVYRVPLHMLGDLEKASYASIEQQSMDFMQNTVAPWVIKWEAEAYRKLLLEREKPTHEVRFNLDAMLRASTQERYAAYMTGRQAGFLTTNEIRRKENLPPVEGGDVLLQPLNMAPSGGPVATPPTPASKPADSNAARSLVEDAARRVLTKEVKAMTRAAKKYAGKPEELRSWADEFYGKHEGLVARVFAAPLKAAGVTTTPEQYAKDHCAESVRSLADAVATSIAADVLADEWESIRPGDIANHLIK
jgi:HK97 family phage portal protein